MFITFHVAGDVVMLNMTILRERVPLACSFRGNSSSWQQGVAADHSAPIVRKQNEQEVEPDSTTSRPAPSDPLSEARLCPPKVLPPLLTSAPAGEYVSKHGSVETF